MKIFARHALTDGLLGSDDDELLLEGSWLADAVRAGRTSLDDSIDARFAWIDRQAIELAEMAAGRGPSDNKAIGVPYINALSLRYYLVKLLRVLAYFRDLRTLAPGERVALHLSQPGDQAYVDLLQQLAQLRGAKLDVHWHGPPSRKPPKLHRSVSWRQWAARAHRWPAAPVLDDDDGAPRVVLCGSPRILNPICVELVARDCRVWWLYERFALRCWWRWRGAGVEQLVCENDDATARRFNDVWSGAELLFDGVDLAKPVERWLAARAAEAGQHQSLLIERIETHFRAVRPNALVLDEDATPLKRIATALARRHGARSSVVQHGAPCGPFGFVPPAADEICVWGESSRRQLAAWGVAPSRMRLTGWPNLKPQFLELEPTRRSPARGKRFLLLATVEPRDERPDNVEFHLTTANYALMFQMVHEVLSGIAGAKLTIKLHPRSRKTLIPFQVKRQPVAGAELAGLDSHSPGHVLGQRCPGGDATGASPRPSVRGIPGVSRGSAPATSSADGQRLPVRVVDSNNLARLVAASDCVISCASTAGIEAALAGAPVVQLLPIGSGNVLPAEDWGSVGTARTSEELATLVNAALERGWCKPSDTVEQVLAETGEAAAGLVVDGLIAASERHALLVAAGAESGR